jgi:hypothetical protein
MLQSAVCPELSRAHCQTVLEKAGFAYKASVAWSEAAQTPEQLYALERAAQLVQAMKQDGVLPHVAASYVSRALDLGGSSGEGRELLDWCEMAVEICRHKKRSGQNLKNAAGLLVKIVKDPATRRRVLDEEMEAAAKERYRQRERAIQRQNQEAEERAVILEYEQLSDSSKQALWKEKAELLRREGRLERMAPDLRDRELTDLVLQDLARTEVPPYGKWLLRKRAGQAVLPFSTLSSMENIA